jgi:predicted ATPase
MKIAFTGAPGTGKSSVFDEIQIRHFSKVPEVARRWLNFTDAQNLSHYRDRDFFQKLIEINHILNYTYYMDDWNHAIFDRSLPDEIAYRRFFKCEIPETLIDDCNRYRVDKVFIFPYWEEIYKNDEVRAETKEEAKLLDELIMTAYTELGYEPIIVPKMSIEKRIEFVTNEILKN